MIKRIIFDIDETLIRNKKSWYEVCKDCLEKQGFQMNDNDLYELIKAFETYEKEVPYYNEKEMIEYMRKHLSYPIPNTLDFLNNDNFDMIELFPHVKEILAYLSTKYELVILSNWIAKTQNDRLIWFDIKKYFKACYYPEDFPKKPDPKAYEIAMGGYKPEECLMIGDNLDTDLKTPHKIGMHTLLFDPNHKYHNPFTKTFQDYNELKEIL